MRQRGAFLGSSSRAGSGLGRPGLGSLYSVFARLHDEGMPVNEDEWRMVMTAACGALQRSLFETLLGAPELTSLLGGPHIYNTPPKAGSLPCITLGQTVNLDWSTGAEAGRDVTLHVWTSAASATEVHEIILALRALLDDRPLTIEEPANLRHDFTQVRIDPDGETLHGIVRYRAETEPVQAGEAQADDLRESAA